MESIEDCADGVKGEVAVSCWSLLIGRGRKSTTSRSRSHGQAPLGNFDLGTYHSPTHSVTRGLVMEGDEKSA